ncbi:MAG TPA: precorrin-8X methylmutase [Stellaceae bacterium]|nr:precorrin-8X methylmutase [Stellaceae bacterium]
MLFDHYVIVDWSAANQPKTGRDSIWICRRGVGGESVSNPPTRHAARELLADFLARASESGERVLLGFDFPFGYPAGFAARLGLEGRPWRALWDELAALVHDNENNRNDRFHVAAALNRRVSNGRFPFWGCPAGFADRFLGPHHHRGHTEDEPLQERRLIDEWMVGAQPCWKLAYTGSVGSQSLTGIPVVRALRNDPRWADRARVWPFETGLALPAEAGIVFAEVWPSWWRNEIRPDHGPPNDKAQVRTVAEIFAARDRAGDLAAWFAGAPGLTNEQRLIIEREEAWTLGVTAPRRRSPRSSALQMTSSLPRRREPSGPWTPASTGATAKKQERKASYPYLRDSAAIYRRSFALVRAEADLARLPVTLRPLAVRLAHAAGDGAILKDLAWSRGAAAAGRRALGAGAPILVDSEMVAAGIMRDRLPAANSVICTLHDPAVPALATRHQTTRSAAAVELWRDDLAGSVVAIGNAPTALFHLLELLLAGAEKPALVLAFPVGFVGAAEAKEALVGFGRGLRYVTLRGRRGGSALAAAAVNALCGKPPA